MAHFYGAIKGARGEASRLGTKKSSLFTTAASWDGAVQVFLFHDAATGQDRALVELAPWHGRGVRRTLYDGPVGGE